MIQRVVKMKFRSDKLDLFKDLFEEVKYKIVDFEGCTHLELLQDKADPTTLFTYSFWQSEEDLNRYRNSELFKKTWKKTKAFFSDRPQAWSTIQISNCTEERHSWKK